MPKRKNILFIVSRLPINLQTGDRARVYHFIKGLTAAGHRVDMLGFIPNYDHTVRTDYKTLCNRVSSVEKHNIEFKNNSRLKQLKIFFNSFGTGYPFRVWQWHDEDFINKATKLVAEKTYDVIHLSEVTSGIVLDELINVAPKAKYVIDLIDSVALSIENSLDHRLILKPFRFIEKKRLKKYEHFLTEKADETVLISERDKDYLGVDHIKIIPNGVSLPKQTGVKRDIDLLFTGNMAAEPNIDAVVWFVKKVMPKLNDLKLYIAGANPPDEIRKLAGGNVRVTGYVEDLNEYYQQTKIFICPMRLGAGQKNKVLEAMINFAPVISTAEGNKGIGAPDNAICIAENSKDFVRQIKWYLNNPGQRGQLAKNGYSYVKSNFSWKKSINLLEQCYH